MPSLLLLVLHAAFCGAQLYVPGIPASGAVGLYDDFAIAPLDLSVDSFYATAVTPASLDVVAPLDSLYSYSNGLYAIPTPTNSRFGYPAGPNYFPQHSSLYTPLRPVRPRTTSSSSWPSKPGHTYTMRPSKVKVVSQGPPASSHEPESEMEGQAIVKCILDGHLGTDFVVDEDCVRKVMLKWTRGLTPQEKARAKEEKAAAQKAVQKARQKRRQQERQAQRQALRKRLERLQGRGP